MVKKHALRATIRSPLVARTAQYAPQEAMPSIMPRMTMVRASPWANNPSVFGRGLQLHNVAGRRLHAQRDGGQGRR